MNGVVLGILLVLSVISQRSLVALYPAAASVGILGFRHLAGRAGPILAVLLAAALAVAPVWSIETPALWKAAEVAPPLVFFAIALILDFSIRRAGLGGLTAVVAIAPSICLAVAAVAPDVHTANTFSPAKSLTHLALGLGLLVSGLGYATGRPLLISLGSLGVAGGLYRGWPLVVFALGEAFFWKLRLRNTLPAWIDPRLWSPLLFLAFFRAVNGGYGFGRVDLSITTLASIDNTPASILPSTIVVLLAYAWPLLLACRLAAGITGRPLARVMADLFAALLVFSGADLLQMSLLAGNRAARARFEELLAFDVILSSVLVVLMAIAAGSSALRRATAGRLVET